MPGPPPELYLRMGSHAEKQYILKTIKLFNGVIIGANLLESTPGASVSLALKILGGSKRDFVIDPMTYTFGMHTSYIQSETIDRTARKPGARKVGLKRSFSKLIREYGEPLQSALVRENRPVTPDDFSDASIRSFCKSVYEYQAQRMKSEWGSDQQLKELAPEMPLPSFAFAPYFYTPYRSSRNSWHRWHELNVALATAFAQIRGPLAKHSIFCVDHEILDSPADAQSACESYLQSGCEACWLWLSRLVEPEITSGQLEVLVNICKMFTEADIKLYNLHGGYLSGLLAKVGMTGFSHGVGYGETKDVVPVIGVTVPTVNYHVPPLHVRASVLDLERALPRLGITNANDFLGQICDCTVCKGVLNGNLGNLHEFGDMVIKVGNLRESQTPDSAKKCRFHFLLARKKELDTLAALSTGDLKQQLLDSYNKFHGLPTYLALRDKADQLPGWRAKL